MPLHLRPGQILEPSTAAHGEGVVRRISETIRGAWQVDNEYLFAPTFWWPRYSEENSTGRDVYLPAGEWIDYQTGKLYSGGWHKIEAGSIPVRDAGARWRGHPQMEPAQSTASLDWSKLDMVIYADPRRKPRRAWCACRRQRPAPGGSRPQQRDFRVGRRPASKARPHPPCASIRKRGVLVWRAHSCVPRRHLVPRPTCRGRGRRNADAARQGLFAPRYESWAFPNHWLTCTTCAGAKPFEPGDEALLYAPIRSE